MPLGGHVLAHGEDVPLGGHVLAHGEDVPLGGHVLAHGEDVLFLNLSPFHEVVWGVEPTIFFFSFGTGWR
jgi:hypothetical protein